MSAMSSLETRVEALVSAYADRAPIDVEPLAMARFAASSADGRLRLVGSLPVTRGIATVLLVFGVLMAIVAGAIVGGQPHRRDPMDDLTRTVLIEPFLGLPPEGAPASTPETGTLVLSFTARIREIGYDVHDMSLYADGRLLWKRNLESPLSLGAFGTSEPTTAVIEQRLTPNGVDLLRAEVLASAVVDPAASTGTNPGVVWGSIQVRAAGRLRDATWSDERLPGRLADPGSWLPASAWADRRIGGYVASRYAVCLRRDPASVDLEPITRRLPTTATSLLADAPVISGPKGLIPGYGSCHQVAVETARMVVAALDRAGIERQSTDPIGYRIPDGTRRDDGALPGVIYLGVVPILPNGEPVGYGG